MRSRKRRRLTRAELRALGITPGLVGVRYGPGNLGRSRVEELAPETDARRKYFARRLTGTDDLTNPSEDVGK